MFFSFTLLIHIAGAVASVGYVLYALVSVIRRRGNVKLLRLASIALIGLQTVSGALLILFSSNTISLGRLCVAGLLYVSLLGGSHVIARRRIRTFQEC